MHVMFQGPDACRVSVELLNELGDPRVHAVQRVLCVHVKEMINPFEHLECHIEALGLAGINDVLGLSDRHLVVDTVIQLVSLC
jgi:hypothetical protein